MRLYAGEWLAFVAWCRVAKRINLPASADTFAFYLLATAPGAKSGTIARKRDAIRAMHRCHHLPLPALNAATRAAVRQAAGPKSRQVALIDPVTLGPAVWTRLGFIARAIGLGCVIALCCCAACKQSTGGELLGLEREQVRFVEAGAELQLARTHQVTVLIHRADTACCPARALEDWLQASDTSFGPVFRKVDRWGNVEHALLGLDGLRRTVARRHAA